MKNKIYRILEFIFSLLGGLLISIAHFLFKIESFFHTKIEFNEYSRWIEEDKKWMKK